MGLRKMDVQILGQEMFGFRVGWVGQIKSEHCSDKICTNYWTIPKETPTEVVFYRGFLSSMAFHTFQIKYLELIACCH